MGCACSLEEKLRMVSWMGRLAVMSLVLTELVQAPPANAYTPTISTSGVPVRWHGFPKLVLAGNAKNASGLSEAEIASAVTRGLQRWESASGGSVGFEYWQGTDSSVYEPASDYNGLSSLYFSSNVKGGSPLYSNVLGLTQVWYRTDTGEILETDIALNDRDFQFTTDPRDTTGSGAGGTHNTSGRKTRVYIENVLTHELGHAFGLSHSALLQSSMLFMESPEQAHLGCDETVGIRAVYPAADASSRGMLSGQVVDPAGKALFGAHVVAISRRRGGVLASAMTDREGNFSIEALEPGEYFLMAEPFLAGSQALPSYYSGMKTNFCPGGENFARTFLMAENGLVPHSFNVRSGASTSVDTIHAQCTSLGGAAVSSIATGSSISTAPVVFDGLSDQRNGFGFADRSVRGSGTSYYRLKSADGHLEIHAVAYSLFSPLKTTLALYDSGGGRVAADTKDEVYNGDSGYTNFDSSLVADSLPPGDYYVRLDTASLSSVHYPAGQIMMDSAPFLLLTGSVNESAPPLSAAIPENARCQMVEDFGASPTHTGTPPRRSERAEDAKVGFCGKIQDISGGGSGSGSGPGPGAILGWFLPWLAMGFTVRHQRRRAMLAHPIASR